MLYTQKLTAQVFITFLDRLIANRTRKLMWIVDRHPVHRSNAVQQWLQEHQDKIEMHLLPPYSPQLNPAEYLNCDCLARSTLEATHAQLDSVKRTAAIASAQITKVTRSNRQVLSASIHCLCYLNRCSVNYCRVNKWLGSWRMLGWIPVPIKANDTHAQGSSIQDFRYMKRPAGGLAHYRQRESNCRCYSKG